MPSACHWTVNSCLSFLIPFTGILAAPFPFQAMSGPSVVFPLYCVPLCCIVHSQACISSVGWDPCRQAGPLSLPVSPGDVCGTIFGGVDLLIQIFQNTFFLVSYILILFFLYVVPLFSVYPSNSVWYPIYLLWDSKLAWSIEERSFFQKRLCSSELSGMMESLRRQLQEVKLLELSWPKSRAENGGGTHLPLLDILALHLDEEEPHFMLFCISHSACLTGSAQIYVD